MWRVGNFGMELHTEKGLFLMAYHGMRAMGRAAHRNKVVRQVIDKVTMTHPNLGMLGNPRKQLIRVENTQTCPAILSCTGTTDPGAKELAADLHAVADSQYGHAQIEQSWVALWSACFVHASRSAREDQACRTHGSELLNRHVRRHEQTKHTGFSYTAGDELYVLGPEIQNGDYQTPKVVRQLKPRYGAPLGRWFRSDVCHG